MTQADKDEVRGTLIVLLRSFDGTPVPGTWVGRPDAMILPYLEDVKMRTLHDSEGLDAVADLFGVAHVDGERFAWVGVIHFGPEPADDRVVDRLFDVAKTEISTELSRFDGVMPWLLSLSGIKAEARARLLEVGALFSGRAEVIHLLDAFDLPTELPV